ncbi:MAG: glucose-6-phosphate dehydrogenase [Patulibacter minatonensis]
MTQQHGGNGHGEGTPDPHVVVLFGARGDLAKRKLLPGLWRLRRAGLLPDGLRIIGSGRHAPSGDFADEVRTAIEQSTGDDPSGDDAWEEFSGLLSFVPTGEDGEQLAAAVADARSELGPDSRTLVYLSVPPSAMQGLIRTLAKTGISSDRARIVTEKPFGHDLESAKDLNATLHEHLDESAIFRIDHFLGKEGVQQILALRFANGLFEPLWNNRHIQSVQIDVPETLGLEGRAAFYEETGAFRDMVVTHLSQVLGFLAMERPHGLESDALHDAKEAVFEDLRPFEAGDVVYGQYEGYTDEEGVEPDSTTPTFVALRAFVDNDRWRGVPFLLRTGKALAEGRRIVTIALNESGCDVFGCAADDERPSNELIFDLGDDPRLAIEVKIKQPGPTSAITRAPLTLDVTESLNTTGLEAYERLLRDVMLGDGLLFTRANEIERLWACAQPLLDDPPAIHTYERGSWGPQAALDLAGPAGWALPHAEQLLPA